MTVAIFGQRCASYACAPADVAESAGGRVTPSPHSSTIAGSIVSRTAEDLGSAWTGRARYTNTWLIMGSSARSDDLASSRNEGSGQSTWHDRCAFTSYSSNTSSFHSSLISTARAATAAADGPGITALATLPPLPKGDGGGGGGGQRTEELLDESHTLTLDAIRDTLIRLEDSIIFNLIERAQYKLNRPTYDASITSVPPRNVCLLEFLLRETEQLHSRVRRYTSPDEHPFFPDAIERPVLPPLVYPKVLCPGAEAVNVNLAIWKMYLEWLLPQLAEEGDDRNYGSAATCDVMCLQALSRRIHYGKFVAEAKYREAMAEYDQLIYNKDREGIMKKLTMKAVEDAVVRRVELKARIFGQDILLSGAAAGSDNEPQKIDPEIVARLYRDGIMPLTKEVEVEYLLRRLDFPRTS
ncbi:hypothetical protein CBR_g48729 [Chara braunii]|uniref:chorismate mutase n=1 Tax=Chara braunii TaxID=69332 RepID=A0A388K4J6_CHABU|nr:hypothetical protein CBR_g48729 [Chara braunii]|eukprot:GBG64980.1 hypothetical protein CBR_g48729 [Chara braunii]